MEAVGHCPSKRLLRGPSFFPDERQLVLLQHTGQSERSFFEERNQNGPAFASSLSSSMTL